MNDELPDWGSVSPETYALASAERAIRQGRVTVPDTAVYRLVGDFSSAQGVFRLEYAKPACVVIEMDHVHSERGGEVKGEVSVYSTSRGSQQLLHRSNLTLSGIRSRQELGNYLTKRTPGEHLDWTTFIETASVETIAAFRAGEPAVLLRDLQPPTEAGYALHPIVLDDEPTIWFGDGGDGKSLLALAAAAVIGSGRDDILPGFSPGRKRRVLYIDFEFTGREHRDRLERVCGPSMPDVLYLRCDGALTYEVDRIQRVVRDWGAEFLVIDSVAFACHDAPETSIAAQEFFRALRRVGLGALCIAHVTKSEAGDQKPFGSAFWHNGARATWYVKRDGDGERISLGLFNRKANTGPKFPAQGFSIAFTPDRGPITFSRNDVADVPALAERLPLTARIIAAVRRGPLTYVELAEETGASAEVVRKTMKRRDGTFIEVILQDGITRWGLKK